MRKLAERLRAFCRNRWLVLVAAMWVQSMAGIGYLFGAISPVLKASLGYNQRQVAALAVAKNIGGYVGVVAGTLSAALPAWAMLLMGAAQNLLGYGRLWLIVTRQAPPLHLCMMCVLIFVGNNNATYFNTASLVTCVQNFPRSRGPMVGILKGFLGLTSAILTQIYTVMHTTDQASLTLMIAVGPSLVAIAMMCYQASWRIRVDSDDNLGQMSQAVGFKDVHIFVSLTSIWDFLGRVGGGYFSEIIVRQHAYPRHIALAISQILIATAHFLFAMAWPGTMYIGTFLVGLGYGAHWAIVPAAVSELFGIKHFGAMYNFLALANPTGSLIFSGLITSTLYDYEAEKQAHQRRQFMALASPRLLHSAGFFADGPLSTRNSDPPLDQSLVCWSAGGVATSGKLLLPIHVDVLDIIFKFMSISEYLAYCL
ncbi:unnamed protein product [Miscanthus lutarioriparius]|uniref:Nodulin-like domain-containing protein n=1 Tax=Miscanthus lutarioriparius TaxID=422564 RepID=A0A811QQ54_9POAL|nr:unnamed protein product [Miscanthus lutarioriparius]